ncbi:transcriptional repressor [Anaerofustis stercorihominis]|uniref:Fur family transcriptional regulator n=1 Tax=Anaerofustis stercorihominis TaxID=214853 RepID=UPI00210CF52D|nr:transcriptional repressor [Anaerofustis stercorihominis]MCQ4796413.1 transcriptional repressor [Anaerofustis stercorihominis]
MTKQRRLIYSIITNSKEHLSAEEIYKSAKKEMPNIAIGTIYRNLNLMIRDGEIRKVEIHNAPDRFDKNIINHDHLICDECGKLKDIIIKNFDKIIEKHSVDNITSYDLNIHYICHECKKNKLKHHF